MAMDSGVADGDFINPNRTHDLVITRKSTQGKIKVAVVPPEQFFISKRADSMEDANFLGDRSLMTISELKEMGFKDVDDIVGNTTEGHGIGLGDQISGHLVIRKPV